MEENENLNDTQRAELAADIEKLAEATAGGEGGGDAAPKGAAEPAKADGPGDEPKGGGEGGGDPGDGEGGEGGGGEEDYAEEQALFDRAIRAGLSSRDVLAMRDRATVERMVEMAEKANGISTEEKKKTENGDKEDGAGAPADDLESVLGQMEEDGGYDANLVKMLKGLVAENRKLRSARETADGQSFLDKQIGALDEGVRSHIDAARKSKLKAKFDLLEAGYKAQNAKVSREEVFREAASLALGDLIGRAEGERKASQLERRKALALARPGGESGQRGGQSAAEDDPFAEFVAAMG